MTTLKPNATEESTYAVVVSFVDDTGAAVTPSAATWTLTDKDNTVKNSRSAVTISGLDTSVTIVLSGDDLAMSSANDRIRKLLIQATYDSDMGTDLPLNAQATFYIDNLTAVT